MKKLANDQAKASKLPLVWDKDYFAAKIRAGNVLGSR